jgi:hypothetical protein
MDEYKELNLDSMLCVGMQVVANSLQSFGVRGRRVSIHDVVTLPVDHYYHCFVLSSLSVNWARVTTAVMIISLPI